MYEGVKHAVIYLLLYLFYNNNNNINNVIANTMNTRKHDIQ